MGLRYFADNSSNAKRALQIWLILMGHAHRRETITYGQLAQRIGFAGAQALARPLGCIMWYCTQNKLAPLTVLVVNKDTGAPSEGLIGVDDCDIARERVFNYKWFDLVPPTISELRAARVLANASE
jgi:putative restriction endonuclease